MSSVASPPGPEARILIVRLSALGDVLFGLPAVDAMLRARPGWTVDWVVEDKAASLLALYPHLSRRIVYPRRALKEGSPWARLRTLGRHLSALRSERYDAVLDFQGNLKSGVHARLARSRRRIGLSRRWSREGNHLFVSEEVEPFPGQLHRMHEAQALARHLLPELPTEPCPPRLVLPEEAEGFRDLQLGRLGLRPGGFVALHPGTSAFGAFKRWRPERFAALADHCARRHELPSLVTWGPGEEELARRVVDASSNAVLAPATGSLAELGAVLRGAAVMVGSDSAPLHLASLLGAPVVALFGPKDARKYGPVFGAHRVVSTYVPCRPCTRRTCPDVLCMEEIRAEQVGRAVDQVLSQSAAAPA